MFDAIIVGSGFAGSVMARELAEKKNYKVLILEKRNHIAGNMFDYKDEAGVLVHKYGPHIFHTNNVKVFEYLSRFTKWFHYQHEVSGNIDDTLLPIPFNLNTLNQVFGSQAERLKKLLTEKYGLGTKIPILKLKEDSDEGIREIADYVYNKIFLNYTMKQWELKPEEISPSVTSRVPIHISFDNRYFQDDYQGLPLDGYTTLFENLLNHENITVQLNTDAKDILQFDFDKGVVTYQGIEFKGPVIYSGPIDEMFGFKYGELPYRSLRFEFETHKMNYYQPKGTVNYPNHMEFTRITEFKHMTGQDTGEYTSIMKEYPKKYDRNASTGNVPFYSVFTDENLAKYKNYKDEADKIKNLYMLGRLAEYKYYNMDEIVAAALGLFEKISE